MTGTKGSHQLDVCRTAHAGHVRAEMPRDLHRGRAYRSGSTIDENSFASLHVSPPEESQRRCSAERDRRGLFPRQIGGLEGYRVVFGHAFVFCVTTHAATAESKDMVASLES